MVTGIDMPAAPIGALRARLSRGLASMGDVPGKIVVFGCQHGATVSQLAAPDVLTLDLVCAAQLPPLSSNTHCATAQTQWLSAAAPRTAASTDWAEPLDGAAAAGYARALASARVGATPTACTGLGRCGR